MKTYAIVSAFPEEMHYFSRMVCDVKTQCIDGAEYQVGQLHDKRIIMFPIGMGTTAAASIITHLLVNFRPDAILFSGTAGGIDSGLQIGDVVIAERAFEAEIQEVFELLPGTPFEMALINPVRQEKLDNFFEADAELIQKAKQIKFDDIDIRYGTIVSSNTFPAPQSLFEKIKSKQPLAIDMEASALYQVGWMFKVPVLVIRGISNLLASDGTDDEYHKSDVPLASEHAARVLEHVLKAL